MTMHRYSGRWGKFRLCARAVTAKLRLFVHRPRALLFYLRHLLHLHGRRGPLIVSYPKSGRTWLERLLVETLDGGEDGGETLYEVTWRMGLPPVVLTHAGSSWEGRIRDEDQVGRDARIGGQRRVIFLYRDPRDVLVSAYYHLTRRTGLEDLGREELIASPLLGLRKVVRFMNAWHHRCEERPETSLLISYEQLHADTERCLERACRHLGLRTTAERRNRAVERCSFGAMQRAEREGRFDNPRLAPADPQDPQSFKVRRGKVGQYLDFFTPQQIAAMDRLLQAELDPAFGYAP